MINGVSFYAAYLAPIVIILILNFVFLILAIRGIFGSAQKTGQKGYSKKRKLRIILSCLVIMGLTWIIGVLAIGPLKTTLQIVFTIFNSLQGAFIFVFYCLLNSRVQEEWKACFGIGTTGEMSSQGSKKTSSSKASMKSSRRRLSRSKEKSSAESQSESRSNDYTNSLLALQRDFINREYRNEGVFINLEDKQIVLSYVGPLEESKDDGNIKEPKRAPHLATSL